jgi:hypothetical protein
MCHPLIGRHKRLDLYEEMQKYVNFFPVSCDGASPSKI